MTRLLAAAAIACLLLAGCGTDRTQLVDRMGMIERDIQELQSDRLEQWDALDALTKTSPPMPTQPGQLTKNAVRELANLPASRVVPAYGIIVVQDGVFAQSLLLDDKSVSAMLTKIREREAAQ